MPARNPRINIVLEPPLHDAVKRLARREGVSLSSKVRDLIALALEAEEDAALVAVAERREQSFRRESALTHEQVWSARVRR